MAPFREQSGNADAKFKFESFDYTNAPKGWTNEILCKNCFDKLTDAYSLGIDEKKEVISQIAAAAKPQSAIQAAPEKAEPTENLAQITKENPIGAIVTVIAIAASILALWKFVFVGISDGWNEASNESPYGKILFYVVCVFMYLYALSVLHKIGGICREISTVMSWIAGIILVAIVASHFPSFNSTSHMPDDSPYYRK
jgi:hypothetical protein